MSEFEGPAEGTQSDQGKTLSDYLSRQQGVILGQAELDGEANVTYGLLLVGIRLAIDEGLHIEQLQKIESLLVEYRNGMLTARKGPTKAPKNRKALLHLRDEAEAHIERLKAQGFDLRAYWEESQIIKVQTATVSHKSRTRIKKKPDSEDQSPID